MVQATKRGSIFRQAALSKQNENTYGPILLARSGFSWMMVTLGALIACTAISYLILGKYKPRAIVAGVLAPADGAVRIIPSSSGLISERRIHEGQSVRQGDVLFVLTDERRHLGHQSTRVSDLRMLSLNERRKNLEKLRDTAQEMGVEGLRGLKEQEANIVDELTRTQEEIDIHRRRLDSSSNLLEKHRRLFRERAISELELQEKEDQFSALQTQLLAMQRNRAQVLRAYATTHSDLRQAPFKMATQLAEIDRDLSVLAQETTEVQSRDNFAITSPVDGVVTAINAEPGQTVSTQALAVILPKGSPLVANLYVTSKAYGFVKVGQTVRLRFQPYPYQIFGSHRGVIIEISHSPMRQEDIIFLPPTESKEPLYRVVVKLESESMKTYGQSIPLQPGTALEADIEQQERRLIEWVLEPVLTAKKYL